MGADYFFLDGDRATKASGFAGSAPLARPFFDERAGRESAQLFGFPGIASGRVNVTTTASAVEGAGVHLTQNLLADTGQTGWRLNLLGGYRYLRLAEGLDLLEDFVTTGPTGGTAVGTRFLVRDGFQTSNTFHGVDFGLASNYRHGPFSLEVTTRLAVGYTNQQVRIQGGREVTTPDGSRSSSEGGLLALSSNIGSYRRGEAGVVPELGVSLGWQPRPRLRLLGGYSLLFLLDVVRPGDQIDTHLNTNLLPPVQPGGPDRPSFAFRESDLWLQGLRLGVELGY
jgi:hypothetical protein